MQVGEVVPDFELPDQTGTTRGFSDFLAKGPVVVYFYPAAMTTGCTKESCAFRDLSSEFGRFGAQRLGISRDSVDRQKEFIDRNHFDFPLLADVDGKVASIFGVRRRNRFLPTKRWTFVIDENGRVLEVLKSESRMGWHATRSLQILSERAS